MTPGDDPLARGARLFNAGEFFAAHEVWEERWRSAGEPAERRLLQGLIQVAAGLHKLVVMKKPDSAVRLLERGLAKLDACSTAEGLDLPALREGTRTCARAIADGRTQGAVLPVIVLRV